MNIEELSRKYVGKEPTKEVVLDIEHNGLAYTISCKDGTIARLIKPRFPGLKDAPLIEL